VRRVTGVRAIAEKIEVRFPSDKKTADDEIATGALSILRWIAVVPSGCVQVKVENGWVNLSGQVEWQFQRAVTENDILMLSGVGRGQCDYNQSESSAGRCQTLDRSRSQA
jgi:osmotically-inducible protein OsmY